MPSLAIPSLKTTECTAVGTEGKLAHVSMSVKAYRAVDNLSVLTD
jgi:hypothetical protein